MRIKLTKKYAVHSRELPIGAELDCTTEKANELISLGVATELGAPFTQAEIDTRLAVIDTIIEDGEVMPETPKDEVKVITPKGKASK